MLHHAHTLVVSVIIMITGADAWSDGLGFARVRGPTRLWAEQNEGDVADVGSKHSGYNVLGTDLSCCCSNVGGSGIGTGFYRNGFCGKHHLAYPLVSTPLWANMWNLKIITFIHLTPYNIQP